MKSCTWLVFSFLAVATVVASSAATLPPRQMENLGRGVVAIHQPDGKVFVSWRLLGTDPENIAFNLYRKSEGGASRTGGFPGRGVPPGGPNAAPPAGQPAPAVQAANAGGSPAGGAAAARGGRGAGRGAGAAPGEPVKLNGEPLTGATCFVDTCADLSGKTS